MVVVICYRSRCPGLISLFLVCRPRVFKGGECILWHPTAAPGVAGVIYHEGGNSPWYTSYGTEIISPDANFFCASFLHGGYSRGGDLKVTN